MYMYCIICTIPGCPDSGCDPVLTSTDDRYNLVCGSSDNLIPKLQVHSRVGAVSTSVPVIFPAKIVCETERS